MRGGGPASKGRSASAERETRSKLTAPWDRVYARCRDRLTSEDVSSCEGSQVLHGGERSSHLRTGPLPVPRTAWAVSGVTGRTTLPQSVRRDVQRAAERGLPHV